MLTDRSLRGPSLPSGIPWERMVEHMLTRHGSVSRIPRGRQEVRETSAPSTRSPKVLTEREIVTSRNRAVRASLSSDASIAKRTADKLRLWWEAQSLLTGKPLVVVEIDGNPVYSLGGSSKPRRVHRVKSAEKAQPDSPAAVTAVPVAPSRRLINPWTGTAY